MKLSIVLPETIKTQSVRELLESEWMIPRKVRHFLRVRKHVLVNQKGVPFHHIVHPGDTVELLFEDDDYPSPNILMGNKHAILPIWEDEHIIIVNKPAGQKTHPNQPDECDTLLNDLAAYLKNSGSIPYVVHRLDKETSGAIVFAKNPIVLPLLGKALESKQIKRCYEAEITGHLASSNQTINKPIGRHRHDRRKRTIDFRRGDHAVTHITHSNALKKTTWINCELETGRTHQIRVHLQSIGHPIVGDPLYNSTFKKGQRLQLHAKSIALVHPFTKEAIDVEAKPFLTPSIQI